MNTKIATPLAPTPTKNYSQAIVAGNTIYTAGQVGLTPEGKLVKGSIEKEMNQVMLNLKAILGSAGFTLKDVVKTTVYISDMKYYDKVTEVYGKYIFEPYPARETVAVKKLPLGANIEISMVAVKQ